MIMFAGQVATWRWAQRSNEEWGKCNQFPKLSGADWMLLLARLKDQENQLLHNSSGELEPILDIKAERTKGKIFPTVWYNFDVQVSAIQHFRFAQLILTAENPLLE